MGPVATPFLLTLPAHPFRGEPYSREEQCYLYTIHNTPEKHMDTDGDTLCTRSCYNKHTARRCFHALRQGF